jgi:hypothetical protein
MTYETHAQPGDPLASAQAPHMTDPSAPGELEGIRREFPRYQIDVEPFPHRQRYVARRIQPGPGPHTFITPDLTELRAELAAPSRHPSRAGNDLMTDTSTPPTRSQR